MREFNIEETCVPEELHGRYLKKVSANQIFSTLNMC